MNKILDKMGIYDLFGVLLSGISMSSFTMLIMYYIYNIKSLNNQSLLINETLLFIIISYFLGVIFQEIGSFFYKNIIYKNNTLLKSVLTPTLSYPYNFITDKEKKEIYAFVEKQLNLDSHADNDSIIYNYCKYSVIEKLDASKMDKDQSLSVMSRSLSLYFFVLFLIGLFSIFIIFKLSYCILSVFSLLLSLLLHKRSIRFIKLRYTYIFRCFYYNIVLNKDNTNA